MAYVERKATAQQRRRRIIVVLSLAALFVFAAVGGLYIADRQITSRCNDYGVILMAPPHVELSTLNPANGATTSADQVTIGGSTTLPAGLELRDAEGTTIDTTYTGVLNHFELKPVALRHGENRFRIVASSCALYTTVQSDSEYVLYRTEKSLQPPVLDTISTPVSESLLSIHGRAAPAVHIKVEANDTRPKNTDSPRAAQSVTQDIWTDFTTGEFVAYLYLQQLGTYAVSAAIINDAGQEESRSATQSVVFSNEGAAPFLKNRTLTVSLALKSFHVQAKAQIDRASAIAHSLAEQGLRGDEFLRRTFGGIELKAWRRGDSPTKPIGLTAPRDYVVADLFTDTQPEVSSDGHALTVTVDSNREFDGEPVDTAVQMFRSSGDFLSTSSDALVLDLRDYALTSSSPQPSSSDTVRAIWRGPTFNYFPLNARVSLKSLGSIRSLGAEDEWPSIGHWVGSIVTALTYAIPFVLLIWYIRAGLPRPWLQGSLDKDLRRLLRRLTTVCFLPLAIDVASTPPFIAYSSPIPANSWRMLGLLAVLGLVGTTFDFIARKLWQGRMQLIDSTRRGSAADRRRKPSQLVALLLHFVGTILGGVGRALIYGAIITLIVLWGAAQGWIPSRSYTWAIWALSFPYLAVVVVQWCWFGFKAFRNARGSFGTWSVIISSIAITIVVAFLAWPRRTAWYNITPDGGVSEVINGVFNEYAVMVPLTAAIALVGFAAVMRSDTIGQRPLDVRLGIAIALFLDFWAPAGGQQLSLPIGFVLSWLAARCLMFWRPRRAALLIRIARQVRLRRPDLVQRVLDWLDVLQLARSSSGLATRVASGEVDVRTAVERWAAIKRYFAELDSGLQLGKGLHVKDVILAVPPSSSSWRTGLRAAAVGLLLAIPILIVNYTVFFMGAGYYSSVSIQLIVFQDVVLSFMNWVVLAFFFGFYFTYLRGTAGVRKGIRLALILALVSLPGWVFNATNIWAVAGAVISVCEYLVFLCVIGIVLFDYKSLREALGSRLSTSIFIRLVGARALLAVGTASVAGAGVSIFVALAGEVVKVAAAQFLGVPTAHGPH